MLTPLEALYQFLYLVASVLFILGLKFLSSPARARQGNFVAAIGMAVATVTLLAQMYTNPEGAPRNLPLILLGIVLGALFGAVGARRVAMTDMPQMVAILNGCGGGSAALISVGEFIKASQAKAGADTILGCIIGAVSLSGSVVAFAKLQGLVSEKAINSPIQKFFNGLLFLTLLGVVGYLGFVGGGATFFYALLAIALVFGVFMVMPIGGADMPVVISVLNSFTGLAVAATGFTLHNNALIISGMLVGASGTLLTMLMCKAMNRSIGNVLFAGFGSAAAAGAAGGGPTGPKNYREVGVDDAAALLANVQSLIIVPGYGMAVAQAQHAVRELADLLAKKGVEVKYAIHPVAGRMPGHMNVLLAEANVPYDQLFDLDQINPDFERADVALVIGANDVVNPAARSDKSSPIYGMPILDADRAQHVICIKRSMNPGFAGIDNQLYYEPRCSMLFGDAKGAIVKLVEAVKSL